MVVKVLVFSRNKRLFYNIWYFSSWREMSAFFREFINPLTFTSIDAAARLWLLLS